MICGDHNGKATRSRVKSLCDVVPNSSPSIVCDSTTPRGLLFGYSTNWGATSRQLFRIHRTVGSTSKFPTVNNEDDFGSCRSTCNIVRSEATRRGLIHIFSFF
ncbi:hypothetical protein KIN20_000411 [Parelaphostrongylus tenuis]|uniref:Uncharacterized protein n=1 Tax=Parelaphostrongylus tenuis TaxID=148309 RepID=A0AAD5LSG0_PARTN|nr:hypothetical protein KIN20_000411 [Parelaphostrongylus tenuis]